jgi:hypothetical protein
MQLLSPIAPEWAQVQMILPILEVEEEVVGLPGTCLAPGISP